MNRYMTIAFSMIAGAALGAGAVQTLKAQAKPPVFQITFQEVSNPEALSKEFVPMARAAVKQYGGRLIASGPPVSIEGAVPKGRVVVNQWDSIDQLKKWHDSPENQAARQIGDKYATFQTFAVDGLPQQ